MKQLLFLIIFLLSLVSFSQQPYYSNVDLTKTGLALKSELSTKITATHTRELTYDQARDALKIIDLESTSTTHVLLIYGFSNNTCPVSSSDDNDHRTRLSSSFGGGSSCEWNREHTYAQSLGTPALGQIGPGADVHHLRSSDVQRNAERGNLKFIDGDGNSKIVSSGWYPGDEWKGDIARMMMYMYVRYGNQCLPSNVAFGTSNSIDSNMINVLLEWNAEDPVSTYEDTRNEYLSNSSNTYYQGNRNPFIDNPYLATIIWGGIAAQDRWNMTNDTEPPTDPTNLTTSNITPTSLTLNWTASTDNSGFLVYEIFKDDVDVFFVSTTNTTYNVSSLTQNTTYTFKVRAKDMAGNLSLYTNIVSPSTLIDVTAPTIPSNLTASNITSTEATLNWTASTDEFGVTAYDIFKDNLFFASTNSTTYNVIGLTPETNYNFTVYAKDAVGNTSLVSNTASVSTLAAPIGGATCGTETFTNIGTSSTSYTTYNWSGDNAVTWSATDARNDQVIIVGNKAITVRNGSLTSGIVSNGISEITVTTLRVFTGGSGTFNLKINNITVGTIPYSSTIQTTTLTGFNISGNIVISLTDKATTTDRIAIDNLTWKCYSEPLSVNEYLNNKFTVYPNPVTNQTVFINIDSMIDVKKIEVMQVTGKVIKSIQNPTIENNIIKISDLPTGFYFLKIETDQGNAHKKIIVN